MNETGIAGLFIALAVAIVLTGPARLLRVGKLLAAALATLRRIGRRGPREAATGE